LRDVLTAESVDLEALSVGAGIDPDLFTIEEGLKCSSGGFAHTLVIIPRLGPAAGPLALVSLFGKSDFPSFSINLGPEEGELAIRGDHLFGGLLVGAVINSETRRATWPTVADLMPLLDAYGERIRTPAHTDQLPCALPI
jgi:hypothetical protein